MRRALLLSLLLAAGGARAARLETALKPREARVGDRITLTVTVVPGPGESPLPFAPPADFGPFELVQAASTGAVTALTLTTFELDVATLPALTFRYRSADGKERTLETPALPVPVKTVLTPEDKGLRGLKGKFRAPPTGAWKWILLFIVAGVLTTVWALRRKKILFAGAPAPPPVPPDEEALAALDALARAPEGASKPYYSRLADVLRLYIERRFGVPALDRTTAEMVPLLRRVSGDPEERAALRELLDTADLAKFARFESPTEERARHGEAVRRFVLATRLQTAAEAAPR